MIIGIWVITIVCIVIVLGEVKYRFIDQVGEERKRKAISKDWKENMDIDLKDLHIEFPNNELVSSQVLSKRGSWRLAQDLVMDRAQFQFLRDQEYVKKL